ncbi:zinc finger CCCH-type antiviral protein 1-like isoform X2 [Dasypus novemcinctus]|uniref:zinc finger CCCH-type antiviral protein 1-like isoform X2 n=1 Tax=Dasypus novemcinctus TaxID=9361 RepID=UPI000C84B452|nr:zinc finger CCCH-type antiviral protein 1-like isoform X2 [Dasypus novemcinctus]
MADPTVCSFLTKVLCANGGRMFLQDLRGNVELSEAKLQDVLRKAGPDRFLMQEVYMKEGLWDDEAEAAAGASGGGGTTAWRVVAVSSVRLCARYQRGECQACDQLHFCRRHMLGKCPNRDCWSTCTLSHDIHTPVNIQVLKNHGLFGLNEAQLRILLLQNDPCLLPEIAICLSDSEALLLSLYFKEDNWDTRIFGLVLPPVVTGFRSVCCTTEVKHCMVTATSRISATSFMYANPLSGESASFRTANDHISSFMLQP